MPINFIPNDPRENPNRMRVQNPRTDRAAGRAGYNYFNVFPGGIYNPVTQPDEFLFWQCREAAIATLEAWESVTGTDFTTWQAGPKIDLRPDFGNELNAYYNRTALRFYHFTSHGTTFRSGNSTDIVSHEAGHGILDALRPDLWGTATFEVNAAHEAIGDCVAILTALCDDATRAMLLANPASLATVNAVESTGEELAAGIQSVQPNHNAAVPRHARNAFQWQLPSTLPDINSAGDAPGVLVNEVHSFGQIFSGCFYDTIVNIFQAANGTTSAHLLAATRTAGSLLAEAIATAPQKVRFFRELGRAMLKADETLNAAANSVAIKAAFEGHSIPLGTGAMTAPIAALDGAAPTFTLAAAANLADSVKRDLKRRLNAVGGQLKAAALTIGGEVIAEVVHARTIDLGRLENRLTGVVAKGIETILVGESGNRAALLGSLPEEHTTINEVETFVRSLLNANAIDFGQAGAVAGLAPTSAPVTHTIRTVGGRRELTRVRYACRCCGRLPGALTGRVAAAH